MAIDTSTSASGSDLQQGSMSGFEVLAQSVAGIAPSAVMATGPALVALGAGGSVLYSYVFSTIILLMIGWCIARFAKDPGTGTTLLSFITRALGPAAGFVGAIGLAFGYVLIAVACLGGIAVYATPLVALVGGPSGGSIPITILVMVIAVVLAALAMVKGVQLSTRLGMALELVSIFAIFVVVVAVLATSGFSSAPLAPSGLSAGSISGGMVLAILGYVGFESAANMGVEASDPSRTIPRAVLGSVLIVGVLYLVSGYAQLVGFSSASKLSTDAAPLNTLADGAGVHALGYLVDIGAVTSFFACVTGSLNAAGRLCFSMGRTGLLHRRLGDVHGEHSTPHVALRILAVVTGVVGVVMTLFGESPVEVFAIAGTIGTYGYMIAYLMVAIGAPLYLRRVGSAFGLALLIGGVATLGMLYVLYRNVWPIPPAPYNVLPWIFLAVLVAAGGWYAAIRSSRNPDSSANPG